MSDTASADAAQDDLACALPHDSAWVAYNYRRLAIRRRMAIAAFMVLLVGGVALISIGMSSDAVAKRVESLSGIISTLVFVLSSIVGAYWGLGSFDARAMGSMNNGSYGSNGNYTTRTRTVAATVVKTTDNSSGRAD